MPVIVKGMEKCFECCSSISDSSPKLNVMIQSRPFTSCRRLGLLHNCSLFAVFKAYQRILVLGHSPLGVDLTSILSFFLNLIEIKGLLTFLIEMS